jgi:MazG family protein
MKNSAAINELLKVMARLRGPGGCPWDRKQNHKTLCLHAIEEVYELLDAVEAGDDEAMADELGDLLLQIVFHCQMAKERGAFDFDQVCRHLVSKLIRRHPHVFGKVKVKDVAEVWANWEKIKHVEKKGTRHERPSALDGIPKHLPALLRAEKLVKKARKAKALAESLQPRKLTRATLAKQLFVLAEYAQSKGWSAEELLRGEIKRRERQFRKQEQQNSK